MNFLKTPLIRRVGVDVLLWLVAVAPLWLSDDPLPERARIALPVLQVVGAGLLAVATVLSRRWPLAAAALPLVFGIAVTGQVYVAQLAVAVIVFAFLLGRRTVGRAAGVQVATLLAVASAALVAAPGALTGEDWFTAASTLLLTVVIPWAVGQYLRQQADLAASGFELAARLEREHARVAGQERLRERARIAADMHDALGHELSLLAVQASALQVTASADPEVRRAAAELRVSAAGATDRLRQIIGVLREDDEAAPAEPLRRSIADLVRRAAVSGVDVCLDADDGAERDLPDVTARAANRVVQEGLTNATKHAPGASVWVTLRRTPATLEVTVANGPAERSVAGARTGPGAALTGYGLIGLEERVRLAGGTLDAGHDGGGYTLLARLPIAATASPPSATPVSTQAALAGARRRLRRGLLGTFWAPAVLGAVLVLVFLLQGGTP